MSCSDIGTTLEIHHQFLSPLHPESCITQHPVTLLIEANHLNVTENGSIVIGSYAGADTCQGWHADSHSFVPPLVVPP